MKHLTNAANFTVRNWMLIIPAFALLAISYIIQALAGISGGSSFSMESQYGFGSAGDVFKTLLGFLATSALGGSIITLIAQLVYQPVNYGLANKGIETGNAALADTGAAITENLAKFIMFIIGKIVLYIALCIAAFLPVLLLKGFGYILLQIFDIVLLTLISLWFPAMVVDGLDVVSALKKSVEIVRTCFLTVFGITFLIGLIALAATMILGLIPIIGIILTAAVAAIMQFVMAVFYLLLYREKTGKAAA
ncbi:MAG TPA: hypothetical protein PLP87_09465 [Clostridiales bacterium]|nr:hypothetical protein [Clostridiales bacterium]